MHILLWVVVAIALDSAQLRLTAKEYDNQFSSYGSINNVIERIALAPMAYRVLIPWCIQLLEYIPGMINHRIKVYELLKIGSMIFALTCVEYALGLPRALFIAAILPVTFMHNYIDCYFELAAFASALSGNYDLTLVSCILLALERETAPLVPLTYFLVTGDTYNSLIILYFTCFIMLAVKRIIGYRPLYCERVMLRKNWLNLKEAFTKPVALPFLDYRILSVAISIMVLWCIGTGQIQTAPLLPLILIVFGFVFGLSHEIRIFIPVFLWLAIGLIK